MQINHFKGCLRQGIWLSIFCMFFLLFHVGVTGAETTGPSLYLDVQQPATIQAGSVIDVKVMISGATEYLAGADFEVRYDPSALEIMEVDGKKLRPNQDVLDADLFYIEINGENSARLAATAKDVHSGYPLDGSPINLATVSFHVYSVKNNVLELINHVLLNTQNQTIQADVQGVEFNWEPVVVDAPEATPSAPFQFYNTIAVTLATNTEGAQIYYTTDNSDPIANGILYSGSILLSDTATLKAVALKNGVYSEVASFDYTKVPVSAPVADNGTGRYTDSVTVALSCPMADAIIYFTTDGSAPTTSENRQQYSTEIRFTQNTTLKAVACKDGAFSDVVTFEYTIEEIDSTPLAFDVAVSGAAYVSWARPAVISGSAGETVNWHVYIYNTANYLMGEHTASGTEFSWQWAPADQMPITGQYTVKVFATDENANMAFEDRTMNIYNYRMKFNDIQSTDFNGNPKFSFAPGESLRFKTNLENMDAEEQDVLNIIQIKSGDAVVFLGFVEGTVSGNHQSVMGIGLANPSNFSAGEYVIESYAWNMWPSQGTRFKVYARKSQGSFKVE